jgi:hypothetical protein
LKFSSETISTPRDRAAVAQPFPTQQVLGQAKHDAEVRKLAQLETVRNDAHEHGSADALERLWGDDLQIAVAHMPVLTKDDAVRFARSGRMKFLRYQTSDIRVRVYQKQRSLLDVCSDDVP